MPRRTLASTLASTLAATFAFDARGDVRRGPRGGMPPEKLASVFEPFYQVDSSMTRRQSDAGLGLGLTLARSRASGGAPWLAQSTPGKGSEFVATVATRPRPPVRRKPVSLVQNEARNSTQGLQ